MSWTFIVIVIASWNSSTAMSAIPIFNSITACQVQQELVRDYVEQEFSHSYVSGCFEVTK